MAEVGEHRHVEVDAVHPGLRRGRGWTPPSPPPAARRPAGAPSRTAGQQALQVGRLGRGAGPERVPITVVGRPAWRSTAPSRWATRGLAVGAGHPGHEQVAGRVAREGRGHLGHGRPHPAGATRPPGPPSRRPARRPRARRPGPPRPRATASAAWRWPSAWPRRAGSRRGRPAPPGGCRGRSPARRRRRGRPTSPPRRPRRATGSSARERARGTGGPEHGRPGPGPADRPMVPPAAAPPPPTSRDVLCGEGGRCAGRRRLGGGAGCGRDVVAVQGVAS